MHDGQRVRVRALDVADVVDGDAVGPRVDRPREHGADAGALRVRVEAAAGAGRLAEPEPDRDRRLGGQRGQRSHDVAGVAHRERVAVEARRRDGSVERVGGGAVRSGGVSAPAENRGQCDGENCGGKRVAHVGQVEALFETCRRPAEKFRPLRRSLGTARCPCSETRGAAPRERRAPKWRPCSASAPSRPGTGLAWPLLGRSLGILYYGGQQMSSSRTPSSFLILPAVTVAILFAAAPARAQYFGRNSVQWERQKFEVLKTRHFDIYYYAEGRLAAEQAGRMAERWYTRLSRILGHEMKERQPVILYASRPQFQQTNPLGGPPGEGTGGVTEAFKRRIVLPVGGSLAETDHVLGHELVHAFQYSMTGQGRISDTNYPSALRMPLWFIEGMAEYLSIGPSDPLTAMWIRDAARKEKGLPTIRQLESPRYFPYRYGQALWAYLAGRYGDRIFGQMLRAIGPRTNDVETVLKTVLHADAATLTKDWHAAIKDACVPVITGKKNPA